MPSPASAKISMNVRRPGRPAFTLIELLVVISVIALLIGILLSALGAAREAARASVCLSQIRQVLTATHLYTGDYDGQLPPHNGFDDRLSDPGDPGKGANVSWCWAQIAGDPEFALKNGTVSRYLQDATAIAGCPSYATPESFYGFAALFGIALPAEVHYGYNGRLLGTQPGGPGSAAWKPYRIESIRDATGTVLFADGGVDPTNLGSPAEAVWPQWELQPAANDPASRGGRVLGGNNVHARHGGDAANVAWADGHASGAQPTSAFSSASEETLRLGTLDPNPADGASNEWWDAGFH